MDFIVLLGQEKLFIIGGLNISHKFTWLANSTLKKQIRWQRPVEAVNMDGYFYMLGQ